LIEALETTAATPVTGAMSAARENGDGDQAADAERSPAWIA
jgi:hypothetical protein